jgi:hypothetical protein
MRILFCLFKPRYYQVPAKAFLESALGIKLPSEELNSEKK